MKMSSAGLASIFSNGYRSLCAPVPFIRALASTKASSLHKHVKNDRVSIVLSCLSTSKTEPSCLSSKVDIAQTATASSVNNGYFIFFCVFLLGTEKIASFELEM